MYKSVLQSDETDKLFQAILELKTVEECYRFFEDICTINEVKAIAQRLKVAMLLTEKHTCHEISESTGASTATISRVNRCLQYGAGGYSLVINRLRKRQYGS